MDDSDLDEEQHLKAHIAWMEAADPDDWHRVMLDFNWSEPLYLLDWIVRQPDCDIATALTIFWLGQPECWICEAGSSDEEPNGYSYLNAEICAYVATRVAAGGYQRSQIAFAPSPSIRSDYVQLVAAENLLANPNFRTHPGLIAVCAGRSVDADGEFYGRYPAAFHHSAYSEWFDEAVKQGVFETPESIELMKNVERADRATLRRLPPELRPEPDFQEAQSEAAFLFLNVIVSGAITAALYRGGFGNMGLLVGIVAFVALTYGMVTQLRSVQQILDAAGWALPIETLRWAIAISFGCGALLGYFTVGGVGQLKASLGAVPTTLFMLAVFLPLLWLVSKKLANKSLTHATLC